MYREPTVFILGAGASWHYGYPTGETLITKMVDTCSELASAAQNMRPFGKIPPRYFIEDDHMRSINVVGSWAPYWEEFSHQLVELRRSLIDVHPLVIDYFLAQNPRLRAVGKFLIAWVLLRSEQRFMEEGGNFNRRDQLRASPRSEDQELASRIQLKRYKDRWIRFIIHNIVSGCQTVEQLMENQVSFVTFNYDTSLEAELRLGISRIEIFGESVAEKFVVPERIFHVYGRLNVDPNAMKIFGRTGEALTRVQHGNLARGPGSLEAIELFISALDVAYMASQNIRTIDGDEKEMDKATFDRCKDLIQGARHIYVLGYGFDAKNNARIGLSHAIMHKKRIMFTNYNDMNIINKRASDAIFGGPMMFIPPRPHIHVDGAYYAEKSIRDVYEALEMDFYHPPD